jgi:hypothetical protein
MDRMQNLDKLKDKNDLLNGYLEAKKEHPSIIGDNEIIGYMVLNVSETVNQLRAVHTDRLRFLVALTHSLPS